MKKFFREFSKFGKYDNGLDYLTENYEKLDNFNSIIIYNGTKYTSSIRKGGELNISNLVRLNLSTGIDFYKLITGLDIKDGSREIKVNEDIKSIIENHDYTIDVYSLFNAKDWIKIYNKNDLAFINNHIYVMFSSVASDYVLRLDGDFLLLNHPLVFEIFYVFRKLDFQKRKMFKRRNDFKVRKTNAKTLALYSYYKEVKKERPNSYPFLLEDEMKIKGKDMTLLEYLKSDSEFTHEYVKGFL